jgi:hypothetical protein
MFCPVHALLVQEVYCSLILEYFPQVCRTVPCATDFLPPRPRFHPKPLNVRFVMENWPTEIIYPNSPLLRCQVYVNECSVSTFHSSVTDPEIDSVLVVLPVQHRCFRVSEFCVNIELSCLRPSAEYVCTIYNFVAKQF